MAYPRLLNNNVSPASKIAAFGVIFEAKFKLTFIFNDILEKGQRILLIHNFVKFYV